MAVVPRPILSFDGGYLRGRGGLQIPYGSTPPPPPPTQAYRPLRIALTATTSADRITELNAAGLDVPVDANLVMWPYATPAGGFVNNVLDTLGANDILVLPEATQGDSSVWPYEIDSSNGFIRNASKFFLMTTMKRGIVGLGPNTVLQTSASGFTAPEQPNPFIDPYDGSTKVGVMQKVIHCNTVNPYFGNLECRSRSFGGIAYNFIAFNKGIYTLENVFGNAAHRGFRASPNGEAGFATCNTGRIRRVRNCEVECRDSTGARVGTSPIMFNNNTGIDMEDMYLHHAVAGMPTAWRCGSTPAAPISYRRVRSEFNGGPKGNGQSLNFELCTGTAEVIDATLICNYLANTDPTEPSNGGLHIGGGSDEAQFIVNVRNATIDKGPRPRNIAGSSLYAADGTFTLAVQHFGYTPQYGLQVNRYDAAGGSLPVYYYGAVTAP